MRLVNPSWILLLVISGTGCGKDSGSGSPSKPGPATGQPTRPAETSVRPAPRLQAALRVGAAVSAPPARDAPHEGPLALEPGAGAGSFRALRPVAVFERPDSDAPIRAAIAAHARLPRAPRVEGPGCPKGYLRLAPGAFVCLTNLKADRRAPQAKPQPTLGANALTPGTYGYIRTGGAKLYWTLDEAAREKGGKDIQQSDTVRWAGKRRHEGKTYWRITSGHFIRGDRVRRFWPSKLKGVDLTKDPVKLPLVFLASRRRRKIGEAIPPVDVHRSPGGAVVATLPRYSAWPVVEVAQGAEFRWYRIPDKGWVSSEMVRLARVTDPPEGLHPDERWIDVDVEEQTLVAYRGRTPVYAALVATGVWKFPTPVGTFRITQKVAEADMKSEPSSDETYRVDHVPWTMYFKGGYALHGAYWHDGFGHARSHGCVNLAPRDARFLYRFARPVVPDGWTRLKADKDHPGTLVRIRGKAVVPKAEPEAPPRPREARVAPRAEARPRPRP